MYGYGLLFSLSGYLGLYVVLTLVKSFGALVAVTGKVDLNYSLFVVLWTCFRSFKDIKLVLVEDDSRCPFMHLGRTINLL